MNPFYLFRVRAQNCAGWGPWSAPTDGPPVELAVDLEARLFLECQGDPPFRPLP